MPRLGEQEERTNPAFPWFVGFNNLTNDELSYIRLDLNEKMDSPHLRDEDRDAYESWVQQIGDELVRRADRLLAQYNRMMELHHGEG